VLAKELASLSISPGDLTGGNRPTFQGGISLDGVWWEPDAHEAMSHLGDVWPGQSGGPFFGWWSGWPMPSECKAHRTRVRTMPAEGKTWSISSFARERTFRRCEGAVAESYVVAAALMIIREGCGLRLRTSKLITDALRLRDGRRPSSERRRGP
jgi:hypothetical protein